MGSAVRGYLFSSIFKKQLVAVTGLAMVGFILGHLAGNLLIYLGPEAFNSYADNLASLGALLWVARIGLIVSAIMHVYLTVCLTWENRRARGRARYEVSASKVGMVFARTTMIYTGILVFCFLLLHLADFTFGDKAGPPSVVGAGSLGLFGLVWNSFLSPVRNLFYILAVCSVGLHLSHGIQSLFQTIGLDHARYTPIIRKVSVGVGVIVAAGFGSIPIYVLVRHFTIGI